MLSGQDVRRPDVVFASYRWLDPEISSVTLLVMAAGDEGGARTAAGGVWKNRGVLEDDTTDDDSAEVNDGTGAAKSRQGR